MRADDFIVARNAEADSSLPFVIRIPLGRDGVVLKTRDTWPRTGKLYCHPGEWPADAEIVERVATRSCVRRGAAIDLVLDRSRENRSQFVFTRIRGEREAIFWQTARTSKQARPNVSTPTQRSAAGVLEILVDSHERYPWKFSAQQATTVRRALAAGDYAVELDGTIVAAVERKTIADLASTLTTGKLRYALADLAAVPRAAVVVEGRYSEVFRLRHVRASVMAEGLAECQVRFPEVPIIFGETRQLAQEWTYRFLGAALADAAAAIPASVRHQALPPAGPVPPRPVSTSEIRAWALANGYDVSDRGRLPVEVVDAYESRAATSIFVQPASDEQGLHSLAAVADRVAPGWNLPGFFNDLDQPIFHVVTSGPEVAARLTIALKELGWSVADEPPSPITD